MSRKRQIGRYLLAIAIVALCALLGRGTHQLGLANANVVMIFLAGVVLVAACCGHGPAVAAAILGVLTFDFFFVDPVFSFAPSDTQYFVDLGVMLGTGLLISELTARLQTQLLAARQQEHRTSQLYLLTRRLNDLAGTANLVNGAGLHLEETFEGGVIIFLRESGDRPAVVFGETALVPLRPAIEAAVARAIETNSPAEVKTGTPLRHTALLVPMIGSTQTLGVLVVQPMDSERFLDIDERRTLETCANLIALSIERDKSRSEAQQAQVQVESEQLRNALLSSVSHDLRTPLATIAVTASSLLDGTTEHNWATKREVIETVVDESHRLAHQVDNLLDMARLDAGGIILERDGQVVEELVGVALSQMRQELKGRPVVVRIPSDLPLIWAASELIERVLVNLLENAIRYTTPDGPIEIMAAHRDDRVEIRIADRGPGLPPGREAQIFEKFFRGKSIVADGQRGVGLGLAICRSIVRAHGGEITAANRPEGGAEFLIVLPCAPQSTDVTLEELFTSADY